MSALYAAQKRKPLPYAVLAMGLAPSDRSWLHGRIAERFELMLQAGLVDEVDLLRKKYALSADLPSMRSVGYRQVWDYFAGKIGKSELRERGIFATRQFAKRQLTWFNTLSSVALFDCTDPAIQPHIIDKTERFIAAAASQP